MQLTLLPPSKWGLQNTKLEFEWPIPIPFGASAIPIATLSVDPAKLPQAGGLWHFVGSTVNRLNRVKPQGPDDPLAKMHLPLSELLLIDPKGNNMSVATVRPAGRPSPWLEPGRPQDVLIRSFTPGKSPPKPNTPALLIYPGRHRATVVPQAVLTALDGSRPLDARSLTTLSAQSLRFDQAGQLKLRLAWQQLVGQLRPGQILNSAQRSQMLELVELGVGRRPNWPAGRANPNEVPNPFLQPPPDK